MCLKLLGAGEGFSHDENCCNYRPLCCDSTAGSFLKRRPQTRAAAPLFLPPSLSLSPPDCLHVSRPLSPGEAAPNQRCDLFIRRLETRPRRRHERPRLVLANCLICLSGDPSPPPHPPTTLLPPLSPPPYPLTAAQKGEELVCVKLRANSGALLTITAGMSVRVSSSASPSSPFIPLKTLLPTLRSNSSGRQKQEKKKRL